MSNSIKGNRKENKESELERIVKKLIEVEKGKEYEKFYTFIKTTDLPFIPCYEKNTGIVYQECFRILHEIGGMSIPVSVALSMHYYVLASLSCYPFSKKSTQYWKREFLLKKIRNEKLLIANTGSVRTFEGISNKKNIVAQKEKGDYVINGEAPYMSLSGVADYLVFTAELQEDAKAVFFVPAKDSRIEFYDTAFGDTMLGSLTKSVKFRDLQVDSANVIKLDNAIEERCEILVYQRSWFQALVSAPYLGATFRVIKCLKEFSKEKIKNGKRLSESENFLDSLGELMLKYKAACQLCKVAETSISNFQKGNKTSLEKMFEASVLSKYFSTHFSEEIITRVRHLMGSHFLSPNSITDKVYKEIVFGALQPMTDIDIKEYFSTSFMDD
ncbi:acyl-CoA dehydrogenase family protein [Aquimarina sediminis]|uniref:acyl-CoA dehydrogenase family protein n=1 Tax=Aquimarina sediminis TaxID=2070536 RepID=UPI000CA074F6|nr:acyl-CoA dehydrogenase family protein [Aquimarina sediminis]